MESLRGQMEEKNPGRGVEDVRMFQGLLATLTQPAARLLAQGQRLFFSLGGGREEGRPSPASSMPCGPLGP